MHSPIARLHKELQEWLVLYCSLNVRVVLDTLSWTLQNTVAWGQNSARLFVMDN